MFNPRMEKIATFEVSIAFLLSLLLPPAIPTPPPAGTGLRLRFAVFTFSPRRRSSLAEVWAPANLNLIFFLPRARGSPLQQSRPGRCRQLTFHPSGSTLDFPQPKRGGNYRPVVPVSWQRKSGARRSPPPRGTFPTRFTVIQLNHQYRDVGVCELI